MDHRKFHQAKMALNKKQLAGKVTLYEKGPLRSKKSNLEIFYSAGKLFEEGMSLGSLDSLVDTLPMYLL